MRNATQLMPTARHPNPTAWRTGPLPPAPNGDAAESGLPAEEPDHAKNGLMMTPTSPANEISLAIHSDLNVRGAAVALIDPRPTGQSCHSEVSRPPKLTGHSWKCAVRHADLFPVARRKV